MWGQLVFWGLGLEERRRGIHVECDENDATVVLPLYFSCDAVYLIIVIMKGNISQCRHGLGTKRPSHKLRCFYEYISNSIVAVYHHFYLAAMILYLLPFTISSIHFSDAHTSIVYIVSKSFHVPHKQRYVYF